VILETIIGALVPVGVEGIKQLIGKFTGGVKATTVEEQIKLDNSEIERIKALAELDKPIGQPSQWVVDLRASSRYIGALTTIGVGLSTLYFQMPEQVQVIGLQAANIAFGFLFGTRIVVNSKK
jgi:hypothetical protein